MVIVSLSPIEASTSQAVPISSRSANASAPAALLEASVSAPWPTTAMVYVAPVPSTSTPQRFRLRGNQNATSEALDEVEAVAYYGSNYTSRVNSSTSISSLDHNGNVDEIQVESSWWPGWYYPIGGGKR
jgi:hypothetical protein